MSLADIVCQNAQCEADAVGEPCQGVQVETKGCGKEPRIPNESESGGI